MVRGLLLGIRASDRDGETIPWGIHRYGVRVGTVAGGEDCGMIGLGGHLGWGGTLSPVEGLCRPAKFPPTGVVLLVACHPRHMYGISGGGG